MSNGITICGFCSGNNMQTGQYINRFITNETIRKKTYHITNHVQIIFYKL